eukprot:CAMPEP_0196591416 /NCGR_PEP_ID=MMETSP1081-20130531/69536_1 /TAXON_ID=36882 /ORGANISM="Pyramimonas amylifera, Strain CCMP720" /LENGTH=284 /DNA_ID=CAMNT_0041914771 /DNA_START=437 /DNA_END=1291 /DNA_ORIENTATION=+
MGSMRVLLAANPSPDSDGDKGLPVVICLHSLGSNRMEVWPRVRDMARRGYLAIAVESRYHGDRTPRGMHGMEAYKRALVQAWKNGATQPFLFDTLWDLRCLVDYLLSRDDVDPARIGITGISMGGMLAWLAAASDPRIAVSVPVIGVQNFKWAMQNDKFQGRVDSIPWVFEAAAKDLNRTQVDSEVVEKVWYRICPWLLPAFDAPFSLPLIAPRPLLVINGELDNRCPMEGLTEPMETTRQEYSRMKSGDNFKFYIEKGVGHQITERMEKEADKWFDRFLLNPK